MTAPAPDRAPAPPSASAPPRRITRPLPGLLRDTAFRRYWTAQTVSRFGDQVSGLALPLVAVTVVHADAARMGILAAAAWLPNLLFGLYAGLWADHRANRRRVMIAADLGRLVLLATVPLAQALGALTLGHLYAVAFAVGTLSVFFEVCNPPVFKALVPPEGYVQGNALTSGSRAMSKVVGPSAAGFAVQLLSAPFALLADALSYLVSALFLSRTALTEAPPAPKERGRLRAALRFLVRSPVIRAALAATATVNFGCFMVSTLFVLYATTTLHLGPGMLGLVLGAGAVGALLGAACATPLTRRIGVGRTFALGCVAMPAPMLLIPAADGPTPVVLTLLFAAEFGSGIGVMWLDIAIATILTSEVPDAMRSSVFGAYQTVNLGTRPLAALTAGALAGPLGPRTTLWAAALGALASFLWLLPSPVLKRQAPQGSRAAEEAQQENESASTLPPAVPIRRRRRR
ncbi:MFS transporter [Streptomyces sp. NPDC052040]|uniref:MFS transporter n=1 Tax=unclassified Streptomyces TaxID=2593676 RepID=UPI0037D44E0A